MYMFSRFSNKIENVIAESSKQDDGFFRIKLPADACNECKGVE